MAHKIEASVMQLPTQIIGPADVNRILRELEAIDSFLQQTAIREPGSKSPKLPRGSQLLEDFAALNQINLLEAKERQQATNFLADLKQKGRVVHMSFASNPSAAFVDKIITWLRSNIHPLLLLQIGLEPTIAAGCILRTANRQFDFSLRQHFIDQRPTLIALLQKSESEPTHVGQ